MQANMDRFTQAPGPAGFNGAGMNAYRQPFGLGRFESAQSPIGTRPQNEQMPLAPGGAARGGGVAGNGLGRGNAAEMRNPIPQFGQMNLGGGLGGGMPSPGGSSTGGVPLGRGDGVAGAGRGGRV